MSELLVVTSWLMITAHAFPDLAELMLDVTGAMLELVTIRPWMFIQSEGSFAHA